jgi:hypothetical protein
MLTPFICICIFFIHSVSHGFRAVAHAIYLCDSMSNEFLYSRPFCFCFCGGKSCLPVVDPPPSPFTAETYNGGTVYSSSTSLDPSRLTMQSMVESLKEELQMNIRDCLQKEWVHLAALESFDPSVILGVPAITTFNVLVRSVSEIPNMKAIKCRTLNSSIVDDKNIPINNITDYLFPKLCKCKASIEAAGSLSMEELEYIRVKLVSGGAPDTDLPQPALAIVKAYEDHQLGTVTPNRAHQINALVTEVNSLALDLSRTKVVMDACSDVFSAICSEAVRSTACQQSHLLPPSPLSPESPESLDTVPLSTEAIAYNTAATGAITTEYCSNELPENSSSKSKGEAEVVVPISELESNVGNVHEEGLSGGVSNDTVGREGEGGRVTDEAAANDGGAETAPLLVENNTTAAPTNGTAEGATDTERLTTPLMAESATTSEYV